VIPTPSLEDGTAELEKVQIGTTKLAGGVIQLLCYRRWTKAPQSGEKIGLRGDSGEVIKPGSEW